MRLAGSNIFCMRLLQRMTSGIRYHNLAGSLRCVVDEDRLFIPRKQICGHKWSRRWRNCEMFCNNTTTLILNSYDSKHLEKASKDVLARLLRSSSSRSTRIVALSPGREAQHPIDWVTLGGFVINLERGQSFNVSELWSEFAAVGWIYRRLFRWMSNYYSHLWIQSNFPERESWGIIISCGGIPLRLLHIFRSVMYKSPNYRTINRDLLDNIWKTIEKRAVSEGECANINFSNQTHHYSR